MAEGQPNDEQLLAQFEEELRRLKVADLLVQTLYTTSSLGYRRLTPDDLDLDQARLAIDALQALLPVMQGAVPEEVIRDFNSVVTNMQLAYAKAASEEPSKPQAEEEIPPSGEAAAQNQPSD